MIDRLLEETPERTDRWLGRLVGVDHKTVGRRRRRLELVGAIPQVEVLEGEDGSTYRRNPRREYEQEFFGGRSGGRSVGEFPQHSLEKRAAAQRKETIELKKDEGLRKDAKGTLAEIHRLAHDIQIHTLDDEPERFVNPEDVARWFLRGTFYRLAKAELAEWVESNQEADDPREEPGPYGRRLLEELDTFDLLADWMRVFADHMRDKVQEELKKEEKGG